MAAVRMAARSVHAAADEVRARVTVVGVLVGFTVSFVLVRMMHQVWRDSH
jgi:hypothetical protein